MSDAITTMDQTPTVTPVIADSQSMGRVSRAATVQRWGFRGIAMRAMFGLTLMMAVMTSVGCFVPIYSARPERRVQQMLYTSEDLRALVAEWERFWLLDSPSHLTPIRTHGGIF